MAAVYVFVGLMALFCIEAMLSGTALITPIDPLFLNLTRGAGILLGLCVAWIAIVGSGIPLAKRVVIIIAAPLLLGYVGGWVAWRVADRMAFGFSSDGFVPAAYPIVSADYGRRMLRPYLGINPFGTALNTNIPVPEAQFDAIRWRYRDYCIIVMQRRSPEGAIQIRTDGMITLRDPAPVLLARCRRGTPFSI